MLPEVTELVLLIAIENCFYAILVVGNIAILKPVE